MLKIYKTTPENACGADSARYLQNSRFQYAFIHVDGDIIGYSQGDGVRGAAVNVYKFFSLPDIQIGEERVL